MKRPHIPSRSVKQSINKKLRRFILIDNDLFALAKAERIIRREKSRRAEIIMFSAAKEAIEYMASEDFKRNDADTIVLADLHMPEIDGLELLDRMGNTFETMKDRLHISFLSAAAAPGEIKQVLSYIFVTGIFRKPFSNKLIGKIIDCAQYPL
jgi:CheY-like chemotaxis protein